MLDAVFAMTGPPADPAPPADKRAFRVAALAARDAIPADVRAAASAVIADLVDHHVLAGLPAGSVVAIYHPKRSEVDTAPIAERARARGIAVAFPRVEPGRRALGFHRVEAAELVAGIYGLREPRADAPAVALTDLAAIIVPGVAFDAAGNRIGWGRGHYDATLIDARSIPSIGIAFACQLVASVPVDDADVPVHLVVTEAGVHRAASG